MRTPVWCLATVLPALLLLGCPALAPAQSATTGALAGTVLNPAGEPVPNVAVTITSAATSQSHSSSTAPDGGYSFSLLPPGAYEVRFAAQGFKTSYLSAITVNISEVATSDAMLERGGCFRTGPLPVPKH